MLRWEDDVRNHRYFYSAAQKAINTFIAFHDRKPGMEAFPDWEDHTSEERERFTSESKQWLDAAAVTRAAKEATVEKVVKDGETVEPPVDPLSLDPLKESTRLLNYLQNLVPNAVYTSVLGAKVYHRRGKYLLMLKSLKTGMKIAPNDPDVHLCLANFLLTLDKIDMKTLDDTSVEILNEERSALLQGRSLETINTEFLSRNQSSLAHRLAVARVMLKLSSGVAAAGDIVSDLSACPNATWEEAHEVNVWLKKVKYEAFHNFLAACRARFPLAAHFLEHEDLQDLKSRMDTMNSDFLTTLHLSQDV